VSPLDPGPDDDLLRPREVAAMLGVRTATIARWAREGLLKSTVLTPSGHRRYRRADVRAAQQATGTSEEPDPEQQRMTQDAVRLYDQGWPIRLVAEQFGLNYGPMRRILSKHTALRNRGTGFQTSGGRVRHPMKTFRFVSRRS
jgi:transposase